MVDRTDGQTSAPHAAGIAEPAWPAHALPRLTVVNGYRIERVLGHGGFGITYLARDLLDQAFAVKEYFPRQFAVRQSGGGAGCFEQRALPVRGMPARAS